MFLFSYLFAGMMPIYISGGGRKRGVISGGAQGIGSGGATRTEAGSAQNKVSGTLSYQHNAPQHQVSCFKICFSLQSHAVFEVQCTVHPTAIPTHLNLLYIAVSLGLPT